MTREKELENALVVRSLDYKCLEGRFQTCEPCKNFEQIILYPAFQQKFMLGQDADYKHSIE